MEIKTGHSGMQWYKVTHVKTLIAFILPNKNKWFATYTT